MTRIAIIVAVSAALLSEMRWGEDIALDPMPVGPPDLPRKIKHVDLPEPEADFPASPGWRSARSHPTSPRQRGGR